MKTVEQLAREADIEFGDFQWIAYDTDLQRFHDLAIAQYRESLLAGVGEPQKIEQTDQYGDAYGYTADQLAAAVAIEREAALSAKQEPDWTDSETGLLECWKNRLHPMSDRLLMADGAIAFRDKIIANLRSQLASLSNKQGEQERISELEAQNAQMLGALKSALWRMKEYNYQAMEGTIAKVCAAIAAAEGKV